MFQDRGGRRSLRHPRRQVREQHVDCFRELNMGVEDLLQLTYELVPLPVLACHHVHHMPRSLHLCA